MAVFPVVAIAVRQHGEIGQLQQDRVGIRLRLSPCRRVQSGQQLRLSEHAGRHVGIGRARRLAAGMDWPGCRCRDCRSGIDNRRIAQANGDDGTCWYRDRRRWFRVRRAALPARGRRAGGGGQWVGHHLPGRWHLVGRPTRRVIGRHAAFVFAQAGIEVAGIESGWRSLGQFFLSLQVVAGLFERLELVLDRVEPAVGHAAPGILRCDALTWGDIRPGADVDGGRLVDIVVAGQQDADAGDGEQAASHGDAGHNLPAAGALGGGQFSHCHPFRARYTRR